MSHLIFETAVGSSNIMPKPNSETHVQVPKYICARPISSSGTGQKLEGGEGWCKDGEGHGFSCKHKREGQTIWCMSLRGGHYFLCKDAGVKESIYNSSLVTVILL